MNRLIQSATLALGALGAQIALAQGDPQVPSRPYVVQEGEAEVLVDRQGRINTILVSPATGSRALAMGTQRLPPGTRILEHKHESTEEILYITKGSGVVSIDGQSTPVQERTAIYVPAGTWHGVENPDGTLRVLWVVTPPGLEEFLRGVSWPPGDEPKALSPEDIGELERLHDSVTRKNH